MVKELLSEFADEQLQAKTIVRAATHTHTLSFIHKRDRHPEEMYTYINGESKKHHLTNPRN